MPVTDLADLSSIMKIALKQTVQRLEQQRIGIGFSVRQRYYVFDNPTLRNNDDIQLDIFAGIDLNQAG